MKRCAPHVYFPEDDEPLWLSVLAVLAVPVGLFFMLLALVH